MWERFGQLGKQIIDRAISACGDVRIEHEVPVADAQSSDVYFVPDPSKQAERSHLGWLGQVTEEPCLLELLQRTPGPIDTRKNLRKQLTLDHGLALDAEKGARKRPPLLRLWQITTSRPREVLEGYRMERLESWPSGFWFGPPLLGMGIVVLAEVPRRRDTLLLRLLGHGRVLREAIADLKALPDDAREREVALPPLIALRFEVKQDPTPDSETGAFLMATQNLYEQWEKRIKTESEARGEARGRAQGEARGRAEGEAQAILRTLVTTYETRFGAMPQAVRKTLAKAVTPDMTELWVGLFVTASAKEIAAALRKGTPTRG